MSSFSPPSTQASATRRYTVPGMMVAPPKNWLIHSKLDVPPYGVESAGLTASACTCVDNPWPIGVHVLPLSVTRKTGSPAYRPFTPLPPDTYTVPDPDGSTAIAATCTRGMPLSKALHVSPLSVL